MKITVNFDLCESNALCCALAPEVFELGEDESLYIIDKDPPDSMRADVEEAARCCPKGAISIED